MSFIRLEDDKIIVTPEGMVLSEVVSLKEADGTKELRFFWDAMKYIYFVYKKDGIYYSKFPEERKKYVIEYHVKNRTVDEFEKNPRVKNVIKKYDELQEKLPSEKLIEKLKEDIEQLLEHLSKIPYTKSIMVDFDADVEIDGEKQMKHFRQKVEVDNSEEKSKAMALALKLVDYEKKLMERLTKERKSGKKQRLIDY